MMEFSILKQGVIKMFQSPYNVKILLFVTLFICFAFYLFMGIYSYRRDKTSKTNVLFFSLCMSASLWAIGYAAMLFSSTIEIANVWRVVAGVGWGVFHGIWVSFAFSLGDLGEKKSSKIFQTFMYLFLFLFLTNYIMYSPSDVVGIETYGFVDNLYSAKPIGMIYSVFAAGLFTSGLVIIYLYRRNTQKNRVLLQLQIILVTSLLTFGLAVLTDLVFPVLGIVIFPSGIIFVIIGTSGMWYAINKHRMMSLSTELISEYIFETVNEPIFVLGEDFLVKNCNEAALKITGYHYRDMTQNSLDAIINFRSFNFNPATIIQAGNVIKIEVDLHTHGENEKNISYELSASIVYDKYKDILGFLIMLHDISEMKSIAETQKRYTVGIEESNVLLKTEIVDRIVSEDKVRQIAYYDTLTELPNRKNMLEEVDRLLINPMEKFAVLFLDLDKFKNINDTYGHDAGDYILKAVAVRLKGIVRSSDTISRIGGDEFVILLKNLKSNDNAEKIASAVVDALKIPFAFTENQLSIGGSIGISLFPENGMNSDALLKAADSAMYEVKSKGGSGYKVYSTSTRTAI